MAKGKQAAGNKTKGSSGKWGRISVLLLRITEYMNRVKIPKKKAKTPRKTAS